MKLDEFETLVRSRRATRHFKSDPIPEELLSRLLDAARWAPSGYNLQPTHFVVVTDPELKKKLHSPCLNQQQILEAPATVVFTGDRKVYQNNFEKSVALDIDAGATSEEYRAKLKQFVSLAFEQGPAGLGWLAKSVFKPLRHWFTPTPDIPAVQKRYWLTKQVILSAMNFILAARAAGLDTVPMEGFDEARVRRALKIPCSHIVPLVVPVGYASDVNLKKTRLPLKGMLHWNGWS